VIPLHSIKRRGARSLLPLRSPVVRHTCCSCTKCTSTSPYHRRRRRRFPPMSVPPSTSRPIRPSVDCHPSFRRLPSVLPSIASLESAIRPSVDCLSRQRRRRRRPRPPCPRPSGTGGGAVGAVPFVEDVRCERYLAVCLLCSSPRLPAEAAVGERCNSFVCHW